MASFAITEEIRIRVDIVPVGIFSSGDAAEHLFSIWPCLIVLYDAALRGVVGEASLLTY